jgi:hypothetical protein
MNFDTQIATSVEQSIRLLTLGLKKESADMYYSRLDHNDEWTLFIGKPSSYDAISEDYLLPAWSLTRLVKIGCHKGIGIVVADHAHDDCVSYAYGPCADGLGDRVCRIGRTVYEDGANYEGHYDGKEGI